MPPRRTEIPEDLRRRLEQERVEFSFLEASEITDAIAEEILALLVGNFDRWPYVDPEVPPIDHLRWRMSGPASPLASMQGRVDGRLIFAATAFSNWMLIDGARRLRVVLLNICIAREHQGRGLFSLSAAVRPYLPGYRCDLSLHEQSQTRRNAPALARKGQAPLANRVTSWFRILRPAAWHAHRGRLAEWPLAAAAWAVGALASRVRRFGGDGRPALSVAAFPDAGLEFDQRFDTLFESAAGSFDVISDRAAAFLRWRYGDRRAGPFVVRVVADGDRLLGYAILRPGAPRAYLADLLALPGRLDVVEALVADAVEGARRAGAAGIECWLPRRHPYRRALRRQGFFDSRRDAGVQYHGVDAPAAALQVLQDPRARVHYTIGDTDLV
jgi:hypothetical protein